jgi:hypothetical protein
MTYSWFQLPLKHPERNKRITTDLRMAEEIAENIITPWQDTIL